MPLEDRKKSRVTLLDVARHAGVSRATASLVVRKSPLVGTDTRARVETSMRDLGYIYNMGAAQLRAEYSNTVGVMVPNLTNPFFAELISGMEQVLEEAGKVVLLANSRDLVERQDTMIRRMREHGVDGVVLCPAAGTDAALLEAMDEIGLPLVQVLRHVSDAADYAGVDYAAGMRQAVDHLAALGHRDIAFAVHGAVHSAYLERVEGFRAAIASRGLASGMIVRMPDQTAQIPAAAHLLFELQRRPTAVVCFNDVVALGLSAGLHDLGLRVGEAFSLVGFDDVAEAETMRPRLTSVSTMPVTIGSNAARLLVERLRNPGKAADRVVVPTHLHVRQSSIRVIASSAAENDMAVVDARHKSS